MHVSKEATSSSRNEGNGRIGRLMIALYLVSIGLLARPALYLSAYFDAHRQLYYDNLSRARTHNVRAGMARVTQRRSIELAPQP